MGCNGARISGGCSAAVLACGAAFCQPPEMVVDLVPGADSAAIDRVVTFQGALYFVADDGATGLELWRSDGTATGTAQVADIRIDGSSEPEQLTPSSSLLFFTADDGETGRELWATDGAEAGTRLVKDIRPGASATPRDLVSFGSRVIFSADDGVVGRELWISDGTEDGTTLVVDMHATSGSFPQHMTVYNGAVYFSASDAAHGQELWRTDGTPGGTVLVRDIHPAGHSSPQFFTVANNLLFFSTFEPAYGQELWRSDGTETGTQLVFDVHPSGQSFPMFLTGVDNWVYFSADDGVHGRELWRSDGTTTALVCDSEPGPFGSFPEGLTAASGGALFFTAAQTDTDREAWRSDGTEPGTVLLKDIRVPGTSQPGPVLFANGFAYFRANDQVVGSELWVSDGTPQGTAMLADIYEGNQHSTPANCVTMAGRMYFTADDGVHGRELWSYRLPGMDETPPAITVLGPNPALTEQHAPYTDPGATAFDNIDGDITSAIAVTNPVNTSVIDTFTVSYSVMDSSGNSDDASRTVDVLAPEPPVLTLLGDNPVELEFEETYLEPGYTAIDNVDGNITANVEVTGSVNAAMHGMYTLTYTVSDAAGHEVSEQRTVHVAPPMGVFAAIGGPSPAVTVRGPVTFDVTYTNAAEMYLSEDFVMLETLSGNATGQVLVEPTGPSSAEITVIYIAGEGELAISIGAGSALGLDGSLAPAAGPSASVMVLRDSDGDGIVDELEEIGGTDPHDPDDTFTFWTLMALFDAQGAPLYDSVGQDFFSGDLDVDILPDRYELALVAYVVTTVNYPFSGIAQDMFLRQIDTLRSESVFTGIVENSELVIAAIQMIGADLSGYWRTQLGLSSDYELFLHGKSISEPLTGSGNFDGDFYTNADEYLTVIAHGGGLWDFIIAATQAARDGQPFPASTPWMLAALAAIVIAIAWRARRIL